MHTSRPIPRRRTGASASIVQALPHEPATVSKLRLLFLLLALTLTVAQLSAALVTVLPNNLGTSGNGRAPQGSRLFINTVYLITPAEMASFGVDQVTSVGWTYTAATGQNIATTGTLKVYLQNTTNTTYSKGTIFSTAGMTKVIDGTVNIPAGTTPFTIDVPVGGPGTSVFSTIAGQGVYVAFEYQTNLPLATTANSPTISCSTTLLGGLGTYQSQTANGTAMTLSDFRPETRFGNTQVDIVSVMDVYCLGATASPFGNPQPLAARVENVSGSLQNFNVNFEVREKATNTLRFSTSVPAAVPANSNLVVNATGWNATLIELDTVIVFIAAQPTETALANNSKGYRHNVTTTTMRYADAPTSTGGVGFNTGSGIALTRYTTTGCTKVEAVQVYLQDVNSIGNTVFAVVQNSAGTIVGTSANLVVSAGDLNAYKTFTIPSAPAFSGTTTFYVGLAQTTTIGLGYFPIGTQNEGATTRPNAYYSTGLAGGALTNYTNLGRWMIAAVLRPLSTTPTAGGSATICEGASTPLSVTGGTLSTTGTYNWYTGSCGGTPAGTGPSINVTPPLGATTYYVRAEDVCNAVNTACASVTVTVLPNVMFYQDADGDGAGDPAVSQFTCVQPVGYVTNNNDQCPADPNKIAPGFCGCGVADVPTTYYVDADGDGFGDPNSPLAGFTCITPPGYVANNTDDCPAIFGLIGSSCDDGNALTINDVIDAGCVCVGTPCPGNSLSLQLTTDGKGFETSWDVVPSGGGSPLCSGGGYANNTTLTIGCCLPDGCYDLRVFDSFGDGMCCAFGSGGYVVTVGGQRVIDNANDGTFTFLSQAAVGFCLPIGTDGLVPTSCDIMNHLPADVLQAQENNIVTSNYSAASTNSGYQFWIFDPDGGYSRRLFLSHAAPGGAWPAGTPNPVKATYLRLSDITVSPVPSFVLLNVRVRSRIFGVWAEFGPACRMMVDPTANCATSQLTTTADPVISCGATVSMLGGTLSTIYAVNVPGATKYQFEFTRPGYSRKIASNTRSLVITGWLTNPVVCGLTYDVRVRVSFDGGASWCPFGAPCAMTTQSCAPSAQPRDAEAATEARFSLYPNPNRDGALHVTLTGLPSTIGAVSMDVTDAFGRLVLSRTLPAAAGEVNTAMDLHGALAAGIYMVTVTAGEQKFDQRLVIQ